MRPDVFGDLQDWGLVLDELCQLANEGKLDEHQHGLIRILRFQGNWRLREEALKRIGAIEKPNKSLIEQVLNIIADDNLYFEARILACDSMSDLLKNNHLFDTLSRESLTKTVEKLLATPQPPIFTAALHRLSSVDQERLSLS